MVPHGIRRSVVLMGAGIVCLYLLIAAAMAATKRPWFDEAAFANPALDLVTRGSMGMTISEPTGFGTVPGQTMVNLHSHVYYSMPLSNLGLAAWYKIVGFGVFRTRVYSILWGLMAMGSWTFLVWTCAGSWGPALLTALLISTDRAFIDAATSGRPDMMSAALGAAALAAYLVLRERSLKTAIFASQVFIALAVFTHPIGGVAGFGVLVLALWFDSRRLRWQHLLLATLPYIVGVGLWGLYISQDPEAFRTQFGMNAAGRDQGLHSPITQMVREIRVRFLERMYLPPYATGARRASVLIPILYAFSVVALVLRRNGPRLLGILALVYCVVFGILETTKSPFYLVHITPVLAACLALCGWLEWSAGGVRRWAAAGVVALLVGIQSAWIAYSCWQNPYRNVYLPAMAFLDREAGPSSLIIGNSELGFHFGFYNNLVDDSTLGYYSGKRADFIVVDDNGYRQAFQGYPSKDSGLDHYIQKTLTEDYRPAYQNSIYTVYRRR
jgi:hypothetical protein